jgi:hypothetical protein
MLKLDPAATAEAFGLAGAAAGGLRSIRSMAQCSIRLFTARERNRGYGGAAAREGVRGPAAIRGAYGVLIRNGARAEY